MLLMARPRACCVTQGAPEWRSPMWLGFRGKLVKGCWKWRPSKYAPGIGSGEWLDFQSRYFSETFLGLTTPFFAMPPSLYTVFF